jgi:hypothetical protein
MRTRHFTRLIASSAARPLFPTRFGVRVTRIIFQFAVEQLFFFIAWLSTTAQEFFFLYPQSSILALGTHSPFRIPPFPLRAGAKRKNAITFFS